MRLVVFSYKHCWPVDGSQSGYATDGGFPLQMRAVSELFDETVLILPERQTSPPSGLTPLSGRNLSVRPFREPSGTGLRRKLAWLTAGIVRLPQMWRQLRSADAVHAVVPGDVGFLGLLLALVAHRPTWVRHCGTWGKPRTVADYLLWRLLERVAGKCCVVLATGGGDNPPSDENSAIRWIFSTSLSEREIQELARPEGDERRGPPRLISVGRLTVGKNTAATIEALARIRQTHPEATLDVLGDGAELPRLPELAERLGCRKAVTFHGNVDHENVLRLLRRAHVMVFPTRVAEGFPKAVLEALACGVPVVAPRVSVLPTLLRDGGGRLVDDVEPETLAVAVLDLLESDERETCREIARRYSLEEWREQIRQHLETAWDTRLATDPPRSISAETTGRAG